MSDNYPGKYFVIEGGDGCGKTTQIDLLEKYLKEKGYDVLIVREPGGNILSEELRRILKDPKFDGILDSLGEFFCFSLARHILYKQKVRPALENRKIVISDRNDLSSYIYQGIIGGESPEFITGVSAYLLDKNGIPYNPDCGILINHKLVTQNQIKRLIEEDSKKHDRFHHKGLDYHLEIYRAYEGAARQRGFKIVDYREGDIDGMQQEIRKHINEALINFKKQN